MRELVRIVLTEDAGRIVVSVETPDGAGPGPVGELSLPGRAPHTPGDATPAGPSPAGADDHAKRALALALLKSLGVNHPERLLNHWPAWRVLEVAHYAAERGDTIKSSIGGYIYRILKTGGEV